MGLLRRRKRTYDFSLPQIIDYMTQTSEFHDLAQKLSFSTVSDSGLNLQLLQKSIVYEKVTPEEIQVLASAFSKLWKKIFSAENMSAYIDLIVKPIIHAPPSHNFTLREKGICQFLYQYYAPYNNKFVSVELEKLIIKSHNALRNDFWKFVLKGELSAKNLENWKERQVKEILESSPYLMDERVAHLRFTIVLAFELIHETLEFMDLADPEFSHSYIAFMSEYSLEIASQLKKGKVVIQDDALFKYLDK